MSETDATPTVFQAIARVIGDLPAVGKDQVNKDQGFKFRGHDDVMARLSPLLAEHGVVIVPDVTERLYAQRPTKSGGVMHEINLHVRFTITGPAGDQTVASTWGEAVDSSDKATNKAMTAAYKYLLGQLFAIRSTEYEAADSDRHSPEDTAPPPDPEELARAAGWKSVAEYQECRSVLAGLVKDIDGPERREAWEHWKLANGVDTAKPFDLATFDAMSEALGQIARGVDSETGEVATTAAVAPQEAVGPIDGGEAPEGQSGDPGTVSGDPEPPELGPCQYCGSTRSIRFVHEGRTRCVRGSECSKRVADAAAGISEEPEPEPVEQGSLT